MDLKTMKSRIDSEQYEVMSQRGGADAHTNAVVLHQDWDAFERDAVLIFNNAMTYNQKVARDCALASSRVHVGAGI